MEVARHTMVAQQIRTADVADERLLERLRTVPREHFVPPAQRALAFADTAVPLGRGQVMFAPMLDARLLQTMAVKPGDHVLEIGTGTGYLTAVLAGLAGHVHSVEIIPEFKLRALENLAPFAFANTTIEIGDGARGWPRHAPYDAILVSGALPMGPVAAFREALAPGGRLVVIVGESPAMEVRLIVRVGDDGFHETSLFETDVPTLINAPQPGRFHF
ncbi:MAG: protein-L-isoaspartate O-methyltransferase [Gammaproteobacteria bacterium]|nr:protein-L-isoaspartate O-methyltransferase [Gammaproteobacteria bacterium]